MATAAKNNAYFKRKMASISDPQKRIEFSQQYKIAQMKKNNPAQLKKLRELQKGGATLTQAFQKLAAGDKTQQQARNKTAAKKVIASGKTGAGGKNALRIYGSNLPEGVTIQGLKATAQSGQGSYGGFGSGINTNPNFGGGDVTELPEAGIYQQAVGEQRGLANTQQQALGQSTQQYQNLANQYATREQGLVGELQNLGQTERTDINARYDQAAAQAKQNLVNRGLTSTSAMDSIMRGVERDRTRELGAFEERLRGQKLDYRTLLSGQTLGAKQQAIDFGAGAAQTNFAAGQVPTQTLGSLANMLAQERVARFGGLVDIGVAGLGIQNRNLAAILQYKSDLAKIGSVERVDKARRGLERYQTDVQSKLGYSGLRTDLAKAKVTGQSQIRAASEGNVSPYRS